MRRILSRHEEERKRRKNQIFLSTMLLLIMFVSVIAYGFESVLFSGNYGSSNSQGQETVKYNGLDFVQQGGFWALNSNGVDFIFRYNPKETQKITSEIKDIESYRGKPLYVYSQDFNQESEIRTNLALFAQRIQNACPEGESCGGDFPSKSCNENFIIIKEGVEGVVQSGGCVYITGKKEDLTMLTDAFLFKVLGIGN